MKNNNNDLVTIAVPTYNRLETLKRTLKSIQAQTYTNIEILISDNCSKGEEIQKYLVDFSKSEPRCTVYFQEKNIGSINNFNFLKEKRNGSYFMWLADDDFIAPNYIESCVNFFKSNEDYVLVGGNVSYIRPDNTLSTVEKTIIENDCAKERVLNYYKNVDDNGIFYGLYRSHVLNNINMLPLLGGDLFFIAEVAFQGKISTTSETWIHREASRLFIKKPWKNQCKSVGLPFYAKHVPWHWVALENCYAIKNSKMISNNLTNNNDLGNDIFHLILKKHIYSGFSLRKRIIAKISMFHYENFIEKKRHQKPAS